MRFICPVCGYPDLTEPPRSEGSGGSYEICPCCRFQFGVSDDDRGIRDEAWRRQWRRAGMPWRGVGLASPPGWDPHEQLKRLDRAGAAMRPMAWRDEGLGMVVFRDRDQGRDDAGRPDWTIGLEEARGLMQGLVGQYVWNVRCLEDRILQAEFGAPHLRVTERPQAEGGGRPAIMRRRVAPAGRWTLFVEDGAWSVVTDRCRCHRDGSDDEAIRVGLEALSGQKVMEIRVADQDTSLQIDFDLSGSLSVRLAVDFDGNDQWILFEGDRARPAYHHRRGFVLE